MIDRPRVVIEIAADLRPGETVTVETEHDADAVDLRLVAASPAPPARKKAKA
jgi:hypothetical protein